jgi:hypothetical protein
LSSEPRVAGGAAGIRIVGAAIAALTGAVIGTKLDR